MEIVEALWMLELISARARAVQTEFLLSGPLNSWFRNMKPTSTIEPRIVMLTIPEYSERLSKALHIGSIKAGRPTDLPVEEGVILHVNFRGAIITLLEDPVIRVGDKTIKINVREYSKYADVVMLGDQLIRLAPPVIESYLWGINDGKR